MSRLALSRRFAWGLAGVPVLAAFVIASAVMATPPADALQIEVTAQQFMWNVRYPGPDGAFGSISEAQRPELLDVPAGRDDSR